MAYLNAERAAQGLPPLAFGAALHLGEMLWGNIGAATIDEAIQGLLTRPFRAEE